MDKVLVPDAAMYSTRRAPSEAGEGEKKVVDMQKEEYSLGKVEFSTNKGLQVLI